MASSGWHKQSRRHREAYYKSKRSRLKQDEGEDDFWSGRIAFDEKGELKGRRTERVEEVPEPSPFPNIDLYRLGRYSEGWVSSTAEEDADKIVEIFREEKERNPNMRVPTREMILDPQGSRFYLAYKGNELVGAIGCSYANSYVFYFGMRNIDVQSRIPIERGMLKVIEDTLPGETTYFYINASDIKTNFLLERNGYIFMGLTTDGLKGYKKDREEREEEGRSRTSYRVDREDASDWN